MKIAIIPARGGSKRIPRKNIRLFYDKPMIAYAIMAAQKSGLFNHIVVSTEDLEIAGIAKQWGAEVPFLRPSNLANDFVGTKDVIVHAINILDGQGWQIDNICCIYPAVPLLRISDLKAALELLESNNASCCFPITEFPSAVQRALKRTFKGYTQPFYPEYETCRTQDLETAYYDVGQFYWGKPDVWLSNSSFYSAGLGLPIPSWRVVDIDTLEDWKRAELIYKLMCDSKDL